MHREASEKDSVVTSYGNGAEWVTNGRSGPNLDGCVLPPIARFWLEKAILPPSSRENLLMIYVLVQMDIHPIGSYRNEKLHHDPLMPSESCNDWGLVPRGLRRNTSGNSVGAGDAHGVDIYTSTACFRFLTKPKGDSGVVTISVASSEGGIDPMTSLHDINVIGGGQQVLESSRIEQKQEWWGVYAD
ncbi:hypothetical protein C8R44DRAFT_726260 [Mycena epipterygia]|nr:hypothetical protein C8R44DRAFT_726260 [Mycena epipterygia]